MNISEHVQAHSRKDVPDRPWRSVRVPWPDGAGKATTVRTLRTPTAPRIGLRDRGRDLPRPCQVIYQSDITLGSARMASATALTDAYRRPHRNDSIAPRDRA
jgi:hypothetical protein